MPKRPLHKVRRVSDVDTRPASGTSTGIRDNSTDETLRHHDLLHLQARRTPLARELARLPYRGPRRKRGDGGDRRPCD